MNLLKKTFGLVLGITFIFTACQSNESSSEASGEDTTAMEEPAVTQDEAMDQQTPQQQPPQQGQQNQMPMQQPEPAKDVSDEELQTYVDISKEIQEVQMGAEQDMIAAVQEQGMEPERFSEIMNSQRNPNAGEVDATEEEMANFKAAQQEVMKVQMEVQQEMMQMIQEEGMEPTRFQQITMALQQNQDLQQRYREMMEPAE